MYPLFIYFLFWVKSRIFYFFAYIWSHHPHFPRKFKLWEGKLMKIWGSNPCFIFFSFLFSNSSQKLGIFDFNQLLISCFVIYKSNKTCWKCSFLLIQKWLKTKICIFYEEFEKEQKKNKNVIDLLEGGFVRQIFSNFLANDLTFHGRWGWWDQIKTSL